MIISLNCSSIIKKLNRENSNDVKRKSLYLDILVLHNYDFPRCVSSILNKNQYPYNL